MHYHLSVRLGLKKRDEVYELAEGSSVSDLLGLILSSHGLSFGDPSLYVYSLRGDIVELMHRLTDGDVVSIYPPTAGGAFNE